MHNLKVLNTEKEDYHVHSLNFSDGMATVDEIVRFAGDIGMKKIVFADHSQATFEKDGYYKKASRLLIKEKRWKNVYNDVEVIFGVEADLLNEQGDICSEIQGLSLEGEFVILSYHRKTFEGDKNNLTQAFINAIRKHSQKINMIGHIFINCETIDVARIVEEANKHGIPFELNCRYLFCDKPNVDMNAAKLMLSRANSIYVTSDAHTLWELKELRKKGFEFLRKNGYLGDNKEKGKKLARKK